MPRQNRGHEGRRSWPQQHRGGRKIQGDGGWALFRLPQSRLQGQVGGGQSQGIDWGLLLKAVAVEGCAQQA